MKAKNIRLKLLCYAEGSEVEGGEKNINMCTIQNSINDIMLLSERETMGCFVSTIIVLRLMENCCSCNYRHVLKRDVVFHHKCM